jgi:hypothetical protein
MPSEWHTFDCPGSTQRWRYLEDGRIEIDGEGAPEWPTWPELVNDHQPHIQAAAKVTGVPELYIATIMAMETRGRSICLRPSGGICEGPGCTCSGAEGCGAMAIMAHVASALLGQPVTCQNMMADVGLAARAGAEGLKVCRERFGDDFPKIAVCYNASKIKCGRGFTFGPIKEACPDPRGWGVVVGCVYSSADDGSGRCAPSVRYPEPGTSPYVCTSEYPRTAIRFYNAALKHYSGAAAPSVGDELIRNLLMFGIGGTIAYYVGKKLFKKG